MPTAGEYRDAALRLRTFGDRIAEEARAGVPGPSDAVGPGPIREVLDDSLAGVRLDLGRASEELRRLAAVCERRAVVCDQYRRELQRYAELDIWTRWWTDPPPRPAWWAEA